MLKYESLQMHLFFTSCSPGEGKIFLTRRMVKKMMRDYFHSLNQSGGT